MTLANARQLRTDYLRLREISRDLNHKLVETFDKSILQEGGRRLGILKRGTLVFNNEDETGVLMDYCIYNVRRQGRNAVERYLIANPPDDDAPEAALLRAMLHATYSMFLVESVERGVGVHVRDLVTDAEQFIIDLGLSDTAKPDLVFASRLIPFDDFSVTGGAVLPVGITSEEVREQLSAAALGLLLDSETDGVPDPAPIISRCLVLNAASQVEYEEPRQEPLEAAPRTRRNDPCPCGSGKKFKHCCLRG